MPNIFLGKTSLDCSKQIIERLKENYFKNPFVRHIVIVPDRVSVSTEVNIFKALNIESTCFIEVLTISRLSSKILGDMQVISKSASCMLMQKVLKESKEELKAFNNNYGIDFASKIYETISQFKSSKINPETICANINDGILQNKLADISLIYTKYQELLKQNNLFDPMDRLDFLQDKISESDFLKNSFVYVLNFESFTFQGFQTIFEIAKNCIQFNIGVTDSDNPANEHIYNKDHKNKIIDLFKNAGLDANVICCKENAEKEFKHLQDNLFAFNPATKLLEGDSINLFEGRNFEEEVLHVCSQIKNMVVNHSYKFEDFFIAVPNLQKRADRLEQIFEDYGFNYFIDANVEFKNTPIVKLVEDLFSVLQENFSKNSVLSLCKNLLFNLDRQQKEDFCEYLTSYSINDFSLLKNTNFNNSLLYENFGLVRSKIFDVLEDLLIAYKKGEETSFSNWVDILKSVFEKLKVEENLQQIAIKLLDKNDIKQARMVEQYFYLMQNVLDEIKNIVPNEKCNFKTFYEVLLSGVSATKVAVAPISANCVFVGDISASFFPNCKVGFVVDASEENFPQKINDFGMISDKEIKALTEFYKLEPTIEELNKRSRFKCFELLLTPNEKLFLSYNYEGVSSQKSKILSDIAQMFLIKNGLGFCEIGFKNYNDIDLKIKNNSIKIARRNFVDSIKRLLDGKEKTKEEITLLNSNIDCKKEIELANFTNEIKLNENIFFVKNTISVSQVESFMTCPFLHFCRYGLKLFDREESDFNKLDVGNILHEVAKIFVQKKAYLDKEKVESTAEKIFDEVLTKEKFIFLTQNIANRTLLKNLKKESVRFCSSIAYQIENSLFKPMLVESRFDDNGKICGIKIKAGKRILSLVGQIDRIDTFKDYFRIIDYKTGSCNKSFKELFFGKKIQLEAYVNVAQKSLKLKPAGFYYLPVKSIFAKDNKNLEESYKLLGVTANSDDIFNASDVRFDKNKTSDIINLRFSKDGKINAKCKVFDFGTIESMSEYAIKLIEKASEDVLKLIITPKPLVLDSDPCAKCSFFSLCKFDEQFGNTKRKPNCDVNELYFVNNTEGGKK